MCFPRFRPHIRNLDAAATISGFRSAAPDLKARNFARLKEGILVAQESFAEMWHLAVAANQYARSAGLVHLFAALAARYLVYGLAFV